MSYQELMEKLNISRPTLAKYLKELGISAKEVDEKQFKRLKDFINQTQKVKMSRAKKKKLEDLGILVSKKSEILALLQEKYNFNESIIKNCQNQLKEDGLFVINKFGTKTAHPAVKMRQETISQNNQIVRLINDLDLFGSEIAKTDDNMDAFL